MISISGFEHLTPLHQSSATVVAIAKDVNTNRPVVLKYPQPDSTTPSKITQIHSEFEILSRINSKYVVDVHGLTESDGLPIIVMEYIEHLPLTVRLQQQPIDVPTLLKLGLELTQALGSIHSFGVIYKNLNPDNILVDEAFSQPRLVDFGHAVLENVSLTNEPARNVEGMLEYMSPEQTGRMNRSLDYRSDIYSLGAVLYQLATGRPPFSSEDFLDLVHQHLAKVPEPPSSKNPGIPPTLDNIILKLLVKEPEERYQSTFAVISDLNKAHDIYLSNPTFKGGFTVALDDVPEQLSIPNRLYDRDDILRQLEQEIQSARDAPASPININGDPGTGKSAILGELAKTSTSLGATACLYAASLVNKDVPYSNITGLLSEISRQLLSRPDLPQLQGLLQSRFGNQVAYLIELCPELHRLTQYATEPVDLSRPIETKARIQDAFASFIAVVAEFTKPLVLAIDNAYWVDESSIELLTNLSERQIPGHLTILAGRPLTGTDYEYFDAYHQLAKRLHVGNLDLSNVNQLLSACTFRSAEEIEDLSLVTFNKTQGNPQSVREFLNEIYRRGLLFFNREHREWTWDLDAISQAQPTHNVGVVLANNLSSLDKGTIEILKIASCIGDIFDLDTIKRVSGTSFSQTSACLIQAVAEGFLLYADTNKKSSYMFAHEQIQQRAYQMLGSIERHQIHAQIGRTYLTLENSEDRIFEVVNQLNNSIDDENDSAENRLELARLNLVAGRKAKNSAAFQASFRYLRTALAVQGKEVWSNYEVSLETHLEAAEAAYYCGDQSQLTGLITAILSKAKTPLDKAKAYQIQLRSLISQNNIDLALEIGHEVLELLNYGVPRTLSRPQLLSQTLRTLLMARSMSSTRDQMTDPTQLAAMKILMIMCQAGYIASRPITAAYTLRMTQISIKGGLAPESSFAFSLFGALIIRSFGTINLGNEFGNLALSNLRSDHRQMFCRTHVVVHNFVSFWKQSLRATLDPLAEAERVGLEQGDIEFAQMAGTTYCVNGFISGQDLNILDASFEQKNSSAAEFNQTSMLAVGQIIQQATQNLIKSPRQPWLLNGAQYAETAKIQGHEAERDYPSLANMYAVKTFLAFVFREFDSGATYSEKTRKLIDALVSSPMIPFFTIFETLNQIQLIHRDTSILSFRSRARIRANLRLLRKWSHHAPMNYSSGYQLIIAELARVNKQNNKAAEAYDLAISRAEKYGQNHILAIALELAGRFYERRNQPSLAIYFLLRARSAYIRWGAVTKVNLLDNEYHELTDQGTQYLRRPRPLIDNTEQAHTDQLDLGSVIKASQVLSGEIILDTLLEKLMQVALENAGAHSAALILAEGDDLCVEVLSRYNGLNTDHKRQRELIQNCYDLPTSVIQYVARTEEDLVLNDAGNDGMFTQDTYISRVKPRSILCFPILSKSHLIGVLYLENLQSKGAFNEDRVAVLKLLASQSAIAIENARLYQQLNESRNKYLALYENAVEGIFEIGMNGELISVNPAAAELMGYPDWVNTGRSQIDFSLFFVNPDEPRLFTRRLLSENRIVGYETKLKRQDNREIWVAVSAQIIFEDDVPVKIDGSVIDITERKLRQQAEQATRMAEAATETKSQFLANMSHEIRTPMNAILGYTRLALETNLSEQQSGYLETIKNSSDHLLRVVNDILDISKIESGKLDLQNSEFDLDHLLKDIWQLFKLEAAAKQLVFTMPTETFGWYVGDSGRLSQVLINLISNAIKFTDQGAINVSLKVRTLTNYSHSLDFVVEDTGCGIAENDLESIFEVFTQTDSGSLQEGTGLGLAITQNLIEKMQGKIEVVSQIGSGSRFSFNVVLDPLESPRVEPSKATPASKLDNRPTLLLVEDNPINRNLAREILRSAGYQVLEAENGQEALDILDQTSVFAVLMDLRMPVMTGNEAIRHIRARDDLKHLPVIALSAGVLQHEIEEAISNGFDKYITKPVDFQKLNEVLAELRGEDKQPRLASDKNVVIREIDFGLALKNHDDDEQLLLRLLQDFIEFYEQAPRDLEVALSEQDTEKAERLMHNLAGLAGTFGADKLMSICRQGEKSIRDTGSLDASSAEAFGIELANLCAAIDEFSAGQNLSTLPG